MNITSVYRLLMATALVVGLATCGDKGDTPIGTDIPYNSLSNLAKGNTIHGVLHTNENEYSSVGNARAQRIERISSDFGKMLALASKMEAETLEARELTGEKIQRFINMFPNPWDADTSLWSKYINTSDSNRLLVAQQILEYMIANYEDPKTQAYAQNHLGRVLFQQGDREKALEMYESVELQPDGDDFWYVDSKDEAASLSVTLMSSTFNKEKRDYYYDKAVDNYLCAISECKNEGVSASLHYLLGYVYINRDYSKALEAFYGAADLYAKAGSDNGQREAKKAYEHYKQMFGAVLNPD